MTNSESSIKSVEEEIEEIMQPLFWHTNSRQEIAEFNKAKAALLSLFERFGNEVIGKDINWNWEERMQFSTRETDALDYMFAVNNTKEDQRKILSRLIGKDGV